MKRSSFFDTPPWVRKLEDRMRSPTGRRVAGCVLITLAVWAIWGDLRTERILETGLTAEAEVYRTRVSKGRTVDYRYEVNGQTYYGSERYWRLDADSTPVEGAKVEIRYLADDPGTSRPVRGVAMRPVSILFNLLLGSFGIYQLGKAGRRRSRSRR